MHRIFARAALALALVALVFEAGAAQAKAPPRKPKAAASDGWPADWARLERQVLVQVNEVRRRGATCGGRKHGPAKPLRLDEALRRAARRHSRDMAEHDRLSHTGSDGSSPWDRARRAGYSGFPNAENVAAGQTTAKEVVESWLSSPGHCANLMNADSNELGVGYFVGKVGNFRHYWTQSFGIRR